MHYQSHHRPITALTSITLAFLLLASTRLSAAVPSAENLSGCKLPNGVVILPAPGSATAPKGTLLKISNGDFSELPLSDDGKVLTPDDTVAKLRASQAADLQYLTTKDGSFWAFSGCINDLGSKLLADAAAEKLDAPLEIRRTSQNPAGLFSGISEGRTYLLQTADHHYALIRLLEKTPDAAVIQFVYQPAADLKFDIPKNDPIVYHPLAQTGAATAAPTTPGTAAMSPTAPFTPTPPLAPSTPSAVPTPDSPPSNAAPTPPRAADVAPPPISSPPLGPGDINQHGIIRLLSASPPSNAPSSESSIDAFTHERQQLIQRRLTIVQSPTHTDADIDRKAQAISDLAALHADEAADLLVSQVSFFNPHSSSHELSPDALHPAFLALKHLGPAASAAALKALDQLDPDSPAEGTESTTYKSGLLAMVVRAVEGDDVAEFLFRRQRDHTTDPKRRAIYDHLLEKS